MGAIGAVIQHFILFLKIRVTRRPSTRFSTSLLASSLGGRVVVGTWRPLPEEKHHGGVLRIAQRIALLLAWPTSRCRLDFAVFRLRHGRGLYADSTRCGECFGTASLASSCTDHHGVFTRSVGSALDCGKKSSIHSTVMSWHGKSWPQRACSELPHLRGRGLAKHKARGNLEKGFADQRHPSRFFLPMPG